LTAACLTLTDTPAAGGAKGDETSAQRQTDPLRPVAMRIAAVAAIFAVVVTRFASVAKRFSSVAMQLSPVAMRFSDIIRQKFNPSPVHVSN
jgi:hypothetical protein